MKKPIKTYFDTFCHNLVITDKKQPRGRYIYIASYSDVPAAETGAENMSDAEDLPRPSLDIDLAEQSGYALEQDDIDFYCVEL